MATIKWKSSKPSPEKSPQPQSEQKIRLTEIAKELADGVDAKLIAVWGASEKEVVFLLAKDGALLALHIPADVRKLADVPEDVEATEYECGLAVMDDLDELTWGNELEKMALIAALMEYDRQRTIWIAKEWAARMLKLTQAKLDEAKKG